MSALKTDCTSRDLNRENANLLRIIYFIQRVKLGGGGVDLGLSYCHGFYYSPATQSHGIRVLFDTATNSAALSMLLKQLVN